MKKLQKTTPVMSVLLRIEAVLSRLSEGVADFLGRTGVVEAAILQDATRRGEAEQGILARLEGLEHRLNAMDETFLKDLRRVAERLCALEKPKRRGKGGPA